MTVLTCRLNAGVGTGEPRFAAQALRVMAPFCSAPFGNRPCCRPPFPRHLPPAPYRDALARSGGAHAYPY